MNILSQRLISEIICGPKKIQLYAYHGSHITAIVSCDKANISAFSAHIKQLQYINSLWNL